MTENRKAGTIHRLLEFDPSKMDSTEAVYATDVELRFDKASPSFRQAFIHEFYHNRLSYCNCGSPGDTLRFIRNVINWHHDKMNNELSHEENQLSFHTLLQFEKQEAESNALFGGIQVGIIQILLNVLTNADVLEHGGGIRNSWLTACGQQLRHFLNEVPDDEIDNILDVN